jgi:hypothetical protein
VQIVLRSTRKVRLVFAVLALFVVTVGFVPAYAPLPGGLHLVDAKAPPANSTSVINNVTVSSNAISLGSVLEANGHVSANGKPLPNASVALHMGDIKVAYAQSDKLGRYAFSVPVGPYYFPAAFSNGAKVYTVVEPHDSSFVDTPSAATSVPVNLAPLYAIVALIASAVVIECYFFVRRFREKGSVAVGAAPSEQAEAPVVASGKTAEEPPPALESAPAPEGATPPAGNTTEEPAPPVTESERTLPAEDAEDPTALK